MGNVLNYKEELTAAMSYLSKQKDTIFLGQSVKYKGNAIFNTLVDVPMEKRIEMPVAEDMQMGMSIGLSLNGYLPISIFPRMDFLIIAMNQLVNHLDKIQELSRGIFCPKVIIRTMIGSNKPLDAGLQHTGDYTAMLEAGLKNIDIFKLNDAKMIFSCYAHAFHSIRSAVLIERGDLY